MSPEPQRARSIFLAAVEQHTPEGWGTYLDAACAGDGELRHEVELLLRAHGQPNSLLDHPGPAVVLTAEEVVSERPGTVIGPYKLLEQIGEGGFGVVFLAEQQRPVRRTVALKVIKPGMDTKQVVARFEAERQALALMDHPNIAHVYDGGATDSGRPFFVMELVKGAPITDFCDQNHLSIRQRLELFVSVCSAVQHAHQKGIIHRDLKPSNVLAAVQDGTAVVKVIDFGIAKATGRQLTDRTLFTGQAQLIGTPLYMSPEQALASGLDIDTRSDIYSLGVLLYELLTGTTPFDQERLQRVGFDEIRRIIREEEPPRPSTRLGSHAQGSHRLGASATLSANRGSDPSQLSRLVRGELDWIVMKALEKDRNRRYETASAFAADVQRYLADEPVLACPPSAWYRLRKFVRRYKGPVLAASLVLLVLVAGIVGTTWGMVRATHAEAEAVSEAKQKTKALEAAEASERDARDSLRLSLYEQARARRFSRQPGQRVDSLEALVRAAAIRPDQGLRDEAIAAMALPDVRLGPTWRAWPPGYTWLAVDGQYRSYARVSDTGVISIRSLPDDQEVQHIDCGRVNFGVLLFSPDGRHLAGVEAGSRRLRVWRVVDRAVVLEEPRPTKGWAPSPADFQMTAVLLVAFSPDSRQLAIGQQRPKGYWIRRFDLAAGQELPHLELPGVSQVSCLAFHPDNRRLAVGYQDANFASVHDATNGELVAKLPVGEILQQVVAWHPDGERLAVAGGGVDARIQIWNVPAKRQVATLEGHVQQVTVLSFHPDGGLLASGSWDGVLRLWDPSTGRPLMHLPMPTWTQFSSDGRWLGVAYHGEQAQLLEVTPTREYRTLVSSLGAGQGGYNEDSDISPDGRLLAQRMEDAVRLWHLPSGRELAVLPSGRPFFQSNDELLIAGREGLDRWPIHLGAAANELRLGPPRTVAWPGLPVTVVEDVGGKKTTRTRGIPFIATCADRSPDGRGLAIFNEQSGAGLLMDLAADSARVRRFPQPHANACYLALSPDGRWLATGGWHSAQVRLWNAETGMMVHEWKRFRGKVFFTPDSRALIISQDGEFTFWDVETLQQVRQIRRDVVQYPGHVAFSPDGLMALEMAPGVIHLKDAAGDRTIARLEDPQGDRAGWMSFTSDGTQLVVTAGYAKAVHVWDLRAIRRRLKEMKLDWDWPEFAPAGGADDPAPRYAGPAWKVQFVPTAAQRARSLSTHGNLLRRMGELDAAIASFVEGIAINPQDASLHWNLGYVREAKGDLDEAIPCYRKAIDLDPTSVWKHVSLGNALRAQGKLDEAIACCRKAIEIDPKDLSAHGSLGNALYDQNKLDEAIAAFGTAIKLEPGLGWAHVGLGLALEAQGKRDKADACYRKAAEVNPYYAVAESREYKRLAIARFRLALLRNPEDIDARDALAGCLNSLAWDLATHAKIDRREPGRAVKMAGEAVALRPQEVAYGKTLGVALYRAGRWEEAIEALERADQLGGSTHLGHNALFLAMAHWRLDNEEAAHWWYDRAIRWLDNHEPNDEELRRFRAEAEALLGSKKE